ncbi:CotH kinase family protein [Roseimarinus sediminis]|uniref:CotH kinase family protein n=1 Tax=Roseimarinus sediminis TaxID=1610899 RepID=UPI003D1D7CEB
MVLKNLFTFVLLVSCLFAGAQVVINEVVSSNSTGIVDEDQETNDWIELYNFSNASVNLEGFILNDDPVDSSGWVFPAVNLAPKSYLLLFASGKDRNTLTSKYTTIIRKQDVWRYKVPSGNDPADNWREADYNDSGWQSGESGFGYGDADDNTIIQPLQSIYIRKTFTVEDPAAVSKLWLHIDYDDAFVAFINGREVAKSPNITVSNNYRTVNVSRDHEAVLYNDGTPERFELENPSSFLKSGENVLAIQAHNVNSTSSDFSIIPFLTLASDAYSVNDVAEFIKVDEGYLHTNFKISNEGESLFLFNAQRELIDSLQVVELPSNVSYGRFPDGAIPLRYFMQPTPGAVNANPSEEIMSDSVEFSLAPGYYPSGSRLSMKPKSGVGDVHYTIDGTEPTRHSAKADGVLMLYSNLPIRARVIRDGVAGPVQTSTYLVDAEHSLPVVSLVTDPKHFFDYHEGIYADGPGWVAEVPHYGANYWMDWEKPVNVELIDQEGSEQLNQLAGVKIMGGWTRANAQKALALFARKSYGDGDFDYPFFAERVHDEYDNFVLRASGNDWGRSMLRDGFFSELAKGLNIDRVAFQPSVLYINGEYWGVQNIREKVNTNYLKRTYGIDEDAVSLLETTPGYVGKDAHYTQLVSFLESNSLQSEADYQKVLEMIDVDNYTDYFMFQIYIYNRDWPGNNIKYWRTDYAHSRWRWIMYDTDFGFGIYDQNEYNHNAIEYATSSAGGRNWQNPAESTLLFRKLLSNISYRNLFINRMADNLNTRFQPDRVNAKIDSIQQIMQPEMRGHFERWGQNYSGWQWQVDQLKTYNQNRIDAMRDHIRSYFNINQNYRLVLRSSDDAGGIVELNSLVVRNFPFSGIYFQGIPVRIKAIPNPGYRFVKWEGTSVSDKNELFVNLNSHSNYNAVFEKTDESNKQLVINEINYSSTDEFDTGDWIELYNAGEQIIELEGWTLDDGKFDEAFVFTAGSTIWPDSYLVIYADSNNFIRYYPSLKQKTGTLPFKLNGTSDVLSLYDDEGTLIDRVAYSSSAPWPEGAAGQGATLELTYPYADNSKAEKWKAGINGGTPGAQNSSFVVSTSPALLATTEVGCFPTRFSDFTTLHFYGRADDAYEISILDLQGRVYESLSGTSRTEGAHYLKIFENAANYRSGIYLVQVKTSLYSKTLKVIKY